MPAIQRPQGTHDVLPADSPAWEWLYQIHRQLAEAHGYRGIETPVFEATEMFARGIGAGTDVVDKEMYSFETRGGDALTLRPEGTPATVRAVLGAHLDQELRPIRVHYAGPMFRYDRPQKGRYREFHQVGVEAIGERNPALDSEIIEIGWRFFQALGIEGVSLQLNTLGDVEDRRRYRETLVSYYTPQLERLCADCQRRLQINPLRLLDCKLDSALVVGAPHITDSLSEASADYYRQVVALVGDAGIRFTENPRLVRGLDYYAHTTFEFWHTSLQGAQNALGGGGRYDGLAEVLGFAATPGVGYALGVERALMLASELGTVPMAPPLADVLACPLGAAAIPAAASIARILRADGLRVILDGSDRRLDKKLRTADRVGARACVIVGEDEIAQQTATVRDLGQRTQQSVPLDQVSGAVAAIVADHAKGEER